jgi:hypothetical protein
VPDEEGRAKLTKLYAGGLDVSEQLLGEIVSNTKGRHSGIHKRADAAVR